jgi:hypothetical protein
VTYYKATRTDSYDFYTGTLHHEVGVLVEHPVSRRFSDMVRDDAVTYLSLSVDPTDLPGAWWPLRLWEVEPIGRVIGSDDYPNKRGCIGYRVVAEAPTHVTFGPNGVQVEWLCEQLEAATEEQFDRLAEAEARASAWASAWASARASARARARAWARARASTSARARAWARAWARAGVLALDVRDLITTEDFDVLYGPCRDVFGDPPEGMT